MLAFFGSSGRWSDLIKRTARQVTRDHAEGLAAHARRLLDCCVAAPRYVSVPDVPPRPSASRQLSYARRAPGPRVMAKVRSRFTLLMERLIIDVIQQCSTVIGACRIARITWDEAWSVMTRAVARGRARKVAQPIPYIGVDEKAFRKGHSLTQDRLRSGPGDR